MGQQTLLLVDGFNLLSRGYFATAYGRTDDQLTRSSKGIYTNGLRVFFQKLFTLIKVHNVTHVAIAWDVKREETARRIKYDFYKGTRNELPLPLIQQYETLQIVLEQIGIKQVTLAPHEADDIIGTLSHLWSKKMNQRCYIYSNDRDLLQLLDDNITQIIASKQGELLYTIDHFRADYGIESSQWVDVKALLGDKSDNIPGCPGIGEKSALPLIQHYQTIENLYEQLDQLDEKFNRHKKKLFAGRETTIISKELATIVRDIADFEDMTHNDFELNIIKEMMHDHFADLELKIIY